MQYVGRAARRARHAVPRHPARGDQRDARAAGGPASTGPSSCTPTRSAAWSSRSRTNGRLEVRPVGTHSARFAEGAQVRVFTDQLDSVITGTVLPLKASGHRYNELVDTQGVGWQHVEVRLDEQVHNAAEVRALGIDVGDFVALLSAPDITPARLREGAPPGRQGRGGRRAGGASRRSWTRGSRCRSTRTCSSPARRRSVTAPATGSTPTSPRSSRSTPAVVAPGQQSTRGDRHRSRWRTGSGRSTTTSPAGCARSRESHELPLVRDVFDYYRSDRGRPGGGGRHPGRAARLRHRRDPRPRAHPPRRAARPGPAACRSTCKATWCSRSGTRRRRASSRTSRRCWCSRPGRRAPGRGRSMSADAAGMSRSRVSPATPAGP